MNSSSDDVWLHELRNAINSALISTSVARSLLESGDTARAMSFVLDAQAACESCRMLVLEEPLDDTGPTAPSFRGSHDAPDRLRQAREAQAPPLDEPAQQGGPGQVTAPDTPDIAE